MRSSGNVVEDTQEPGSLYIVSTPIGNLEDITYRGVRILKEVDLIAAEDTRRTRKLLVHYHVFTPITSYHDHNEQSKTSELLRKLLDGCDIALVSDAGTPGISDPGYRLIKAAVEEGLEVVPIPGASAVLAALSVCGMPINHFYFQGFLPPKKQKRLNTILELSRQSTTSVLFVSPHKLNNTLEEIKLQAGSCQLVLIREITKVYEEIIRGTAAELLKKIVGRKIKGEITLIMKGKNKENLEIGQGKNKPV